MRLFTGIDLPEEVREKLERLLMHLRPCAHLKWSPVYNLHVTLKFIGEWPEDKLPQLEAALKTLVRRKPIAAELKGLGWFPNPHHPRVFWVGVQGGDALPALVKDIDAGLHATGNQGRRSGFQRASHAGAHQRTGAAAGFAERDGGVNIGGIWFVRSGSVSSVPQPARSAGSIYTKLSEYPFKRPSNPNDLSDRLRRCLPRWWHPVRIFARALEDRRRCARKRQRQHRSDKCAADHRPRHRGGNAGARYCERRVRGMVSGSAFRRFAAYG